ncbi:CpaF family protein [soil metagenome]
MGLFVRGSSDKAASATPRADSKRDPLMVTLPEQAEKDAAIPVARPLEPTLTPERMAYLQQLRHRIHQQLVERLDVQNLRSMPANIVRQEVSVAVRDLCRSEKGLLSSGQMEKLMEEVMDETFGLGPLESLLKDPNVTDILVNRHDRVYVERRGRLELTEVQFRDTRHLRQIIDRIVALVGRRIDENSPMVDARLQDGSRVNAIIPPLSLDGPAMSIRRFGLTPMKIDDLIQHGSFPPALVEFFSAAVRARCNILISGGTGSGKTTLLNCLSHYIPPGERIVTIEDAAELQLQQPHVVRLETRPPNIEGKGEVTPRDLVRNSLRMRPDRIIIGEVRGPEALDMLQAMNTGHEGSMTTIHANNPRDALSRLEVTVSMSGYDFPIRAIRQQISSAIQLVVQTARLTGGRRKVTNVSEITGTEGEQIQMHDLFVFEQTGVDSNGHADGRFITTGIRPRVAERIEHFGIRTSPDLFRRGAIA